MDAKDYMFDDIVATGQQIAQHCEHTYQFNELLFSETQYEAIEKIQRAANNFCTFFQNEREMITQLMYEGILKTLSHEMRGPTTAILGYSQLLLQDTFGKLTEEQLVEIQAIHALGVTLSKQVNRLMSKS